jgi:hypothetical protein
MSQSSILTDALSSACWEEKRKKKQREMTQGLFFPGWEMPGWLCCAGFFHGC